MTGETPGANLTQFQLRILALLANRDNNPKGLQIKTELADYYGEDVNHGRLYPNLDQLAENGYLEIGEKDKRTNYYRLTETGQDVIEQEIEWLQEQTGSE